MWEKSEKSWRDGSEVDCQRLFMFLGKKQGAEHILQTQCSCHGQKNRPAAGLLGRTAHDQILAGQFQTQDGIFLSQDFWN